MHPAYSVIFLTTLIGVGQGILVALFLGQAYMALAFLAPVKLGSFVATGSVLALVFTGLGLIASVFHLGRPERAWRSAAMWRTSWLSREVIALPIFMGLTALYGIVHFLGIDTTVMQIGDGLVIDATLLCGALACGAAFGLFVCTSMIYASLKFLQQWATPLTVINFTILGCATGATVATAIAHFIVPARAEFYGGWAIALTVAALCTRSAALLRNGKISPRSSLQTAIGLHHPTICQKDQGAMGGCFNTREFFHHCTENTLSNVRSAFLVCAFVVPTVLLVFGNLTNSPIATIAAAVIQLAGLVLERWYFFADAQHPQNLYYQAT